MENLKAYLIRNAETGDVIEDSLNYAKAKELVVEYEAEDKADNIYQANFYEIVEDKENTDNNVKEYELQKTI